MAVWQDIWQLGQKVLALTQTTETNTSEIKKLQEQQLKLTREVIRLKQELELERQSNLHQKELYQSEIKRYKAELDNKLKELEILLLRAKIDAQASTPDKNQSNYLEPGKDEQE
jgi:seryl-tRNA synthetase